MATKEPTIWSAISLASLLLFLDQHAFNHALDGIDSKNDNTPPPIGSATSYVNQYLPLAQATEQMYQVPALFTLAQAGLESGWGASDIAVNANNHFGIKADSSWSGPTYKGYRKYADVQHSYDDHGKFLTTNQRYSNAFNDTNDPVKFAQDVAADGYSTDPNYATLIAQVIGNVKTITG